MGNYLVRNIHLDHYFIGLRDRRLLAVFFKGNPDERFSIFRSLETPIGTFFLLIFIYTRGWKLTWNVSRCFYTLVMDLY